MVTKLLEEEKEVLYWFSCGDSLHESTVEKESPEKEPPKTYAVSGGGILYMDKIAEDTMLSLVKKGTILPCNISVKEWKVQVALGTAEEIKFELTSLGWQLGTDHLSSDRRKELKKERTKILKDRSFNASKIWKS